MKNKNSWRFFVGFLFFVLVIGVLVYGYQKRELKSIPVESTSFKTTERISFEERCHLLMVEAQEKATDVVSFRYDPLTASCYVRYLRPEFWSGQDCLALLPSEAVKSKDVANAMRHNAEHCQEEILELKVAEF